MVAVRSLHRAKQWCGGAPRTQGGRGINGSRRSSAFWGLGRPKTYHEIEDSLVNRRHRRIGHLFQGRFKAILVERDSHLLELARYVVLNPVRAGMVADVTDYSTVSKIIRGER